MSSPYDASDYFPLDTSGFEALSVSTSAVGFTAATQANAIAAFVSVEGAPIRYRADGTNPTASVGTLKNIGDEFVVWGSRDLASIRFISQNGAAATLNTHFARRV